MLLFTLVTPRSSAISTIPAQLDLAFRGLALGTIAAAVPVAFLRIDRAPAAHRT
jgi:hypothetical protein